MEDGTLKLDMISLSPSNSSVKPSDAHDMIPMSLVPTSDQSARSLSDPSKIQAFNEFVEEPLHTSEPSVHCWTLSFFQPYFSVNTAAVRRRLIRALIPVLGDGTDFFEGGKADLYGPFWLVTTLICAVTIVGNEVDSKEGYSVSMLVMSAGLLYGTGLGVPLIAYCLMRGSEEARTLLDLISLYCYSYAVFIPTTLLTVFLSWELSIAALVASTIWSLFFLLRSGFQGPSTFVSSSHALLIISVLCGHLAIAFCLSWYLVRTKI